MSDETVPARWPASPMVPEGGALVALAPGRSDKEIAAEYRRQLEGKLADVVDLMNEINRAGLQAQFLIGRDAMGRNRVADISFFRPL